MVENELVFFYLMGVCSSVVGVLGLVMNGLSLMVLGRRALRGSNSSLYLIAIGVYDVSFLLMNFMITSLDWFVYGLDNFSKFSLLFTVPASVVMDPIIAVTISGSVYTTVALTIDRSIAVVNPLNWSSISTRTRVKGTLLSVFIWSILSTGPLFAEFQLRDIFIRQHNRSYLLSTESTYASSSFHQDIYLQYFVPLTTFVVPTFAIFIPNVVIIVALKTARKTNRACAQKSKQSESTRLTAQVLFISLFSLVSRLLHGASYLVLKQERVFYVTDCSLYCATIAAVNGFILTVNPSVNFLCYCIFGIRFRKEFIDMVSSCLKLRSGKTNTRNLRPSTPFNITTRVSTTTTDLSTTTNGVSTTTTDVSTTTTDADTTASSVSTTTNGVSTTTTDGSTTTIDGSTTTNGVSTTTTDVSTTTTDADTTPSSVSTTTTEANTTATSVSIPTTGVSTTTTDVSTTTTGVSTTTTGGK